MFDEILGTTVQEPKYLPHRRRYMGASLHRNKRADLPSVTKIWFRSLIVTFLVLPAIVATPVAAAKIEVVGDAISHGQPSTESMTSSVAAMTSKGDGSGYWIATQDGAVVNFGGAMHFGDMSGTPLNEPVVGMAVTPSGNGYWLVAADGGIFSFGDARFYGSTGQLELNSPIVGMATSFIDGYWLVAADGGVFAFGAAPFYGSMGAVALNRPIVAMLPSGSGRGYWLLAEDGGIFTFGDAAFYGSGPGEGYTGLFVGMIPTTGGHGYALVHSNGRISPFGTSALQSGPLCDPWPIADMSVAGDGAVLLRTATAQPNNPPSSISGRVDSEYLSQLVIHSQSCQPARELVLAEFALPLSEPVQTSSFGWRRHPIWGGIAMHLGTDFIGPNGTSGGPALAVADGTVLAVLDMVAYGKTVVLNHGEQISTVYAHLGRVSVETGDVVVVGDPLGTVGSTGLSTGIHLHFELRVNGTAKDPVPYLNFPAAPPAEP